MSLYATKDTGPDPEMVVQLINAVAIALDEAVINEVTTHADLLSCLFTLTKRALVVAREQEDPADKVKNAAEIERVLMDLLVEFGSGASQ